MNHALPERTVAGCPYRVRADASGTGETAVCQLLEAISGVQASGLVQVERCACEACCGTFPPTVEDWNPVIASLVYQLADQVIEAQGVSGCSTEQAGQLRAAALQSLPIVLPGEDDLVDDRQSFASPADVTLEDLVRVLPPPSPSHEHRQLQWSIGVTTAPRRQPTLSVCLESLMASGWDFPHLFVDGPVSVDKAFRELPRSERQESIGAWPAWCHALQTLLDEQPAADVIAIVQDDALFPGVAVLREYVESVIWPGDQPCVVSLYTSSDDMRPDNCWRTKSGVWQLGAVALAFPPAIARELLTSVDRGDLEIVSGAAGIDTRVGVWADRRGVPVWHPSPSLVQHIGQVSSVWQQSRAVGLRRANRFLAEALSRSHPL